MDDSDNEAQNADCATRIALAREIGKFAQKAGDYTTAISALTLHCRSTATEPMPCMYGLGLGVIAQGGKQVMLGEEIFNYGAGQSLLTTVDLPVVSHITHATPAKPFLGLMLTLDARLVMQLAAEMELTRAKEHSYRALSIGTLEENILGALVRLVRPILRPLFPEVPPDHPALGMIALNLTATVFGLGNAATPFGIKAMEELQTLNPEKDTATNPMVIFMAMNTAGVQLVPATMLGVLVAAGSTNPTAIISTTLVATAIGTVVSIIVAKILQRFYPQPIAVQPDEVLQ